MIKGVSIILHYNRHLLIGERTPGPTWPNQLQFPGGRIERGETILQAATRELVEECGLAPIQGRLAIIGHVVCDWPHGGRFKDHAITYRCKPYEAKMIRNKEPKKNKGWVWFPFSVIKESASRFRTPDYLIIKRYYHESETIPYAD